MKTKILTLIFMLAAICIVFGDDTDLPEITIISPECTDTWDVRQYNTPQVLVNVSLNEPGLWCKYELYDSNDYTSYIGTFNMTEFNNTSFYNTTPVLSDGWHSIIVNCSDLAGNVQTTFSFYNDPYRTCQTFGIYKFYVNTPPAVNLISPGNNSFTNQAEIELIFNATDRSNSTLNCTHYIDGNAYMTNDSVNNGTPEIILFNDTGSFFPGVHTWYVNCTDYDTVLPQTVQSEIRTFIFDNETPEIQFLPPTTTPGNRSKNWIFANITASDANLEAITIYLYNSSALINTETCNQACVINFTGLADDTYYLNATANDSAGNKNSSETRTITVEAQAPMILFVPPTTITGNHSQNQIFANVTAIDVNLQTIIIYLYNSTSLINTTICTQFNCFINFAGLSDGTYYLNATANDSAGNQNSTETRTIILDTKAPSIQFVPQTTASGNRSQTWVFANVTADNSGLDAITIYLYNSTVLINTADCSQSPCFINFTGLSEGTYKLNATANDTTGNKNSTGTRTIILDITPPDVILNLPDNNLYTNQNNMDFNWTAKDNFDTLINCTVNTYSLSGNFAASDSIECQSETPCTINQVNFGEGRYIWNVTCSDNANNTKTSETRNFTIDETPPEINLVFPPSNYKTNQTTINFTFNATDEYSEIMNCSLYIPQISNDPINSSYTLNNTNKIFPVSFSNSINIVRWEIECFDTAGNPVTNEGINLTIDLSQTPHPCDLNRDGIYTRDWNDLMTAYKCFLGITKNCDKIGLNDWNNMKEEYLCYVSEIE